MLPDDYAHVPTVDSNVRTANVTQGLLLQFGLPLALEKISGTAISTASSEHWEYISHKDCHFFIRFQVVTPRHNSMERGKTVWDAWKS